MPIHKELQYDSLSEDCKFENIFLKGGLLLDSGDYGYKKRSSC